MNAALLKPLAIACCVVVVLAACRKRGARATDAADPGAAQPTAAPVTAETRPPATEGAGSAPPAARFASAEELAAYNKALYEYCYRVSDIPTDLEDLKRRRGLPPLPVPPPGRRLAYNPDLKNMNMRTAVVRVE